jgi:tight adherence protein B
MTNLNQVTAIAFFWMMALALIVFIAANDWVSSRRRIRSRLGAPDIQSIPSDPDPLNVRQSKGMWYDGGYVSPLILLNKLINQSGTTLRFPGLVLVSLACATSSYVLAYIFGFTFVVRLIVAKACAILLPIMILRVMRDRRHRRIEEQLPEAMNTIVRSLRAGHTTSAAISTVSKHLPDPIGAEFRLTVAEMSFGSDLEAAMNNLYERVGQHDLSLLALAVGIQSKTGGNLTEILSTMARVIRDRIKLRRKARALAADSRVSAYILTSLPAVLFITLMVISPGYYGDVWDYTITKRVLFGATAWALLGDYIISRMARIRV